MVPPGVIFGTRAVWNLPRSCEKILPKFQACIIHWRLLGMLVPLRPLYHTSQTSTWPALMATWVCCIPAVMAQPNDLACAAADPLAVHGELVPSSGNTRWTWWQRCPPEVYNTFPQCHWLLKMKSVDTCQCDHRWYHSYQEECIIPCWIT